MTDPTKVPHPTVELKVTLTFGTPLPKDYDTILETAMHTVVRDALIPLLSEDLAPVVANYCDYDVWEEDVGRSIHVTWDTDGEEVLLPEIVSLPPGMEDADVAEWLSQKYGWLVTGWSHKEVS